ncbi:hypothetical protein [Paraburkholderia sp. XV]|uniref:hypothetical protein n=1 Tax=Paraburkholderia sp. XV TaxID=2831520 RepID=UPI001CD78D0C|nr:hypothetical protein [Paraburkholderia sp. XV]
MRIPEKRPGAMLLENGGTSAKPVMNAARRIFICPRGASNCCYNSYCITAQFALFLSAECV